MKIILKLGEGEVPRQQWVDCGRREEKSHKEGIIFMTEFSWRKRSDGTSPNGRRWKTEVHFLKRKRDLVREFKAMHEYNFFSSWLSKCKCCKAPMSETEHAPEEDHLHFWSRPLWTESSWLWEPRKV